MSNNFQNILAINASAGSGKTYQLTLRYLSLLFLGAHPSKILAVTFTKKAAKEMRERIAGTLMRLESGEIGEGDPLFVSIKEIYEGDIRLKAKQLLSKYLDSNNKISTIDSFVHQILRKFCFYASVRHDFDLFTLDNDELKSRFLELLRNEDKIRLADYLYSKGDTIDRLLALFAALYEEESDLEAIKKEYAGYERSRFFAASNAFLKVANSFYEMLCTLKPQKFAPRTFTSVNEFLKTNSFEKLIIERENLVSHRDYKSISSDASEAMFASLKNALTDYYKASADDTLAFLLHEFDWYKRAKESISKEQNALSFDDIAKIVKELLEDGKIDSDFLYFRLDGEIEHILIDEFQDTSILQFRIIKPLLDEIISGVGTGYFKSFFLVGDPKQSIYRFRGATPGMFENTAAYIRKRAHDRYEEIYLDTNYRSAKNLVSFVNSVFAPIYNDIFKEQKSASSAEGFVECVSCDGDSILKTVGEKITEYIKMGAATESITVLCYTNDDIEEVASYLGSIGIKTQKESSKALIDDENVRTVMMFLEYLLLTRLGRDARLARLSFLSITKIPSEYFDMFTMRFADISEVSKVIFEAIDYFGLANPNTIKLIELASSYEDIHTFLKSDAVKNEKKISMRMGGVLLMTVHKSKGLEFDYCILCDTLKKKESYRVRPILQLHKDFKLSKLVVSSKSAAAMLPDVKAAMLNEERMEEMDLLNANYVAMTRAKNGMCIVVKKEGYSKLSALKITDFVCGAKEFVKSQVEKQDFSSYKGTPLDVRFGKQKDFAIEEKSYSPDDFFAIDFGIAMHSYIEISDDKSSDVEALTYLKNRYGTVLGDKLNGAASLARSFANSALYAECKNGEIYKEISVYTDENGELKHYRIDFLAVFEDRAVIVDFKSSADIKEGYIKQLQKYKQIVQGILGVETKTYLVVNNGGKLEPVAV
ncbi:MAG: RecB-like helicase [Campylobacteraceae bacterium]|nr:RecB-like helicase [Campylobacteraceae bacterium]